MPHKNKLTMPDERNVVNTTTCRFSELRPSYQGHPAHCYHPSQVIELPTRLHLSLSNDKN